MKQTIVFDFDGVISRYEKGWQGLENINEKPVYGIKETIDKLSKEYRIVILSSRCATEEGRKVLESWLDKNYIFYDLLTDKKPQAFAYIDDRAICFDGNPRTLIEDIKKLNPWYEEKKNKNIGKVSPGDEVKFFVFDENQCFTGRIMYEFKITNHLKDSYNGSVFYRVISEFKSYDIPAENVISKVE